MNDKVDVIHKRKTRTFLNRKNPDQEITITTNLPVEDGTSDNRTRNCFLWTWTAFINIHYLALLVLPLNSLLIEPDQSNSRISRHRSTEREWKCAVSFNMEGDWAQQLVAQNVPRAQRWSSLRAQDTTIYRLQGYEERRNRRFRRAESSNISLLQDIWRATIMYDLKIMIQASAGSREFTSAGISDLSTLSRQKPRIWNLFRAQISSTRKRKGLCNSKWWRLWSTCWRDRPGSENCLW